jgi:asparagine synthase (glutamine-hydrolysing)
MLRYRRREEYVEHFEAVFGQAMRAALRAPSTPAVLFSGGIDSSYVLARASEMAPAVRGYTAFVAGSEGMDERRYARVAADRLGIATREIAVDDCWSLSSRYLPDEAFDQPNVPMQAALIARMAEAAGQDGVCVLIDGIGGDEFFAGSRDYVADLLLSGHWLRATSEARAWAREEGVPLPLVLSSAALASLTPAAIRARWRSLRGRPMPSPLFPWIDTKALQALDLDAALELPQAPVVWRREVDLRHFWALHRREALPVIGWRERRTALPAGLEYRSPFWDLRVVELMLRFPSWVHRSAGRTKALLREAMRPRLPEEVVGRADKGAFDELMNAGLLGRERERVEAALLAGPLRRLLYVNADALEAELENYRRRQHPWWHALWRTITAGLWLRQEEVVLGGRSTSQLARV